MAAQNDATTPAGSQTAPPPSPADLAQARAHIEAGDAFAAGREVDRAREAYLDALTVVVTTLDAKPADSESAKLLGEIEVRINKLYAVAGGAPSGSLKALIDAVRSLSASHPANLGLGLAFSNFLQNYGALSAPTDRQLALTTFAECEAVRRKLLKSEGLNSQSKTFLTQSLAAILNQLGWLKANGKDLGGLSDIREAADLRRALALQRPEDPEARKLAWAELMSLAAASAQLGDRDRELAAEQEGVDLAEAPYGADPPTAQANLLRLWAWNGLAKSKLARQDNAAARSLLVKAMTVAEAMQKSSPDDEALGVVAFDISTQLVTATARLGDLKTATDLAQQFADTAKGRFEANNSPENRKRAALALASLAQLHFGAQRLPESLQEARDCARLSREAFQSANAQGSYDPLVEFTLTKCLAVLAWTDPRWQDASAEAVPHLQQLQRRNFAPEQLQILKNLLASNFAQRMKGVATGGTGVTYGGGDGSAIEKAIKVQGAKTDGDGTFAIISYLSSHYPGCRFEKQALVAQSGKPFDVITCRNTANEAKTLYFDISESFGKR